MATRTGEHVVHGTALVIGTAGVLLRGPSGAGKSTLALELLRRARLDGRFAALVADDRVRLEAVSGRLVAGVPPPIRGLAELRGFGLVVLPTAPAAVIRLVATLLPEARMERIPSGEDTAGFGDVHVPHLALPERSDAAASLVEAAIGARRSGATELRAATPPPGKGSAFGVSPPGEIG